MQLMHHLCITMAKRLTITIDDALEAAIREAPKRLAIPRDSSESERLRAYARLGYQTALEREIDVKRLETYQRWADDPEMGVVAEAAFEAAVEDGFFRDE
jgi:hypothetical protein